MSNDQEVPGQQIFEYDQGYTKADLEMMAKYNRACERLCMIGNRPFEASQLHRIHQFIEALLVHLKNGKKPSYYEAWDDLLKQLPDQIRDKVLNEDEY